MQNYRKLAEEDGYIKNQYIALKKVRALILMKISCIVVPFGLILIILAGIILNTPSPDKWKHKDITFSDITFETAIRYENYFLNTTEDGSFGLPSDKDEVAILKQQLKPDQQYHIIYSENIFFQIIESLSSDDGELVKLEDSVANWKYNRTVLYTIVAFVLVLIFIGSFWECRKERRQIKVIKSKITDRMNRKN